ncbi:MBL fold metallo-hydrolase [bacterium]|nr:MBL fold metallo-hydrolase [bacterium]
MIGVTFLGSGSKGNAALLEFGDSKFLLDAGLSCRYIVNCLKSRGVELQELSGIILTHDHQDHIGGLRVLLQRKNIPIFGSKGTLLGLPNYGIDPVTKCFLNAGKETEIDGIRIWPFLVPHDALEPLGLRIEFRGINLSIATDLGHITPTVLAHLVDCDILCVESNYDETLLESCKYLKWLKNRIRSPFGHLSNIGVRGVVSHMTRNLSHLVLVHVSQESNNPSIIKETVRPLLTLPSMKNTVVTVAAQDHSTPTLLKC